MGPSLTLEMQLLLLQPETLANPNHLRLVSAVIILSFVREYSS